MARKTSAEKLTSRPTVIHAPLADRMMVHTSLRFAFQRKRARNTTVRSVTEVICRMRRTLLSVLPYQANALRLHAPHLLQTRHRRRSSGELRAHRCGDGGSGPRWLCGADD